jgi:hypothetical protein
MLGIPHNPSRRIVHKGLISVRVLLLALLLVLAVAASAQADEGAPAGSGENSGAIEAPSVANGAEHAPEAAGGTPVSVKAPEGAGTTTGPVEAPEVVITAPAPAPAEPVRAGPAPTETTAPETVIASPAPVEVTSPVAPVSTEVPLDGSLAPLQEAKEAVRTASVEETPDSLLSPVVAPPTSLAGSQVLATRGEEAAAEAGGTLSTTVLGLPSVGGPTEPPMAADAGEVSVGSAAHMTVAQRAGALSCELSALGGSVANNCSTSWLGATQRALSGSSVAFAASEGNTLAVPVGSSSGGGHGGAAVASPPVSPGPGPAPSGASGSAAGATGLALSGFLTLAGLLLLGAPRAMRRLRLSCKPLLTACFVLIPERPG